MATVSDDLVKDISDTFKKAQQDMTNQDNVLFGTGNVTITKPDGVTKVQVPAWTTIFNIANKSITTDNMSSMNPNFRYEVDIRQAGNNKVQLFATDGEGSPGGWVNNLNFYWHGGYGQLGLVRGNSTDIQRLLLRVKTLGGTDRDWNFLPDGTLQTPGQIVSAGTITTAGQVIVNQNDEAVICKCDTATGATYVRFKDSDNSNLGYVGRGSPGQDHIILGNNISSANVTLHAEGHIDYNANSSQNHRFNRPVTMPSGTVGTTAITSDIRIKTNVQEILNSSEILDGLKGYTYTKQLSDGTSTKEAGVIAQEVKEVFPIAVSEDHEGTLAVNYNSLIAVLIEEVKSLKKGIAELKENK